MHNSHSVGRVGVNLSNLPGTGRNVLIAARSLQ